MSTFKTEQENFWAGEFGNEYISRNKSHNLLASNIHFFSLALRQAGKIKSCLEFGANIGMNLAALKTLYPECALKGIEINKQASNELARIVGEENVINSSIYEINDSHEVDLCLIKGVLIHLEPEMLPLVYQKLFTCSSKFILMAEYYNPVPVMITYRGHHNKLFKRDFAGEFLQKFPSCTLVDYGFVYHRDPVFPQDDITWFLIKK